MFLFLCIPGGYDLESEVIYSDEIPQGIRLNVNGILVIGTKKEEAKQAG
jgi:hypothetical protein